MLHKLFKARSYRKVVSVFAERSRGSRDAARVRAAYPWIDETLSGERHESMAVEHSRYCQEVSSEKMAVSLSFAVFLDLYCRGAKPRKLVDLGSGFSSYVLRRYAASNPGTEVWSVDDDAAWLEKTREYLGRMEQDSARLMTWTDFVAAKPGGFDLVVHDAGSMQFRADNLGAALDLARPGGLVLLDDVHRFDYREVALRELAARKLDHLSTHLWRDGYGRYQYIVPKA